MLYANIHRVAAGLSFLISDAVVEDILGLTRKEQIDKLTEVLAQVRYRAFAFVAIVVDVNVVGIGVVVVIIPGFFGDIVAGDGCTDGFMSEDFVVVHFHPFGSQQDDARTRWHDAYDVAFRSEVLVVVLYDLVVVDFAAPAVGRKQNLGPGFAVRAAYLAFVLQKKNLWKKQMRKYAAFR